mmetsp:Transcript_19270/g.44820  ORF Transcript_19270/g.44820 Transcript_19270/m.44820 type:complete len:260 (-) Transcript_19270:230-1009(-)
MGNNGNYSRSWTCATITCRLSTLRGMMFRHRGCKTIARTRFCSFLLLELLPVPQNSLARCRVIHRSIQLQIRHSRSSQSARRFAQITDCSTWTAAQTTASCVDALLDGMAVVSVAPCLAWMSGLQLGHRSLTNVLATHRQRTSPGGHSLRIVFAIQASTVFTPRVALNANYAPRIQCGLWESLTAPLALRVSLRRQGVWNVNAAQWVRLLHPERAVGACLVLQALSLLARGLMLAETVLWESSRMKLAARLVARVKDLA